MIKLPIYGVRLLGDKIDIQSTMATFSPSGATATAEKQLQALHFRNRIPAEEAHLSPDAAIEAFIAERRAKRDELWHQIRILNGQCEQARSMIGAKS